MSPVAKLFAAGLIASLPAAALAHHGWSSYNEAEAVSVTGPLKEVVWGNPHGTAKITWRQREWDVVLAPVSRMTARGLEMGEINRGQPVTLTGYIRRDGVAEMRIERIKVGDKTVELR
ncbi:MAG: hypothetical protein B7Z33_03625 [Sphingomonadales bacterium 12-68-11]|nr:MAG: hypothetical protein B7Z33_03625 [Sphingomonadales bacterium 12-68-11]